MLTFLRSKVDSQGKVVPPLRPNSALVFTKPVLSLNTPINANLNSKLNKNLHPSTQGERYHKLGTPLGEDKLVWVKKSGQIKDETMAETK